MDNTKLLDSAAQDGTVERWTSKQSEWFHDKERTKIFNVPAAHTLRSNQRMHKGGGPSSWPSGSKMSAIATWRF